MPLKYPFGPVPDIQTRVSLRYDDNWEREVIITLQQQDGLGLSWKEFEKYFPTAELEKSKAKIESDGGIFSYEPQQGKGHTLTIRYPQISVLYDLGVKATFGEPIKILVIDTDQQFIDEVFSTYVPMGYIVHEANESQVGLEIFKKEQIHLTMVDEHMVGSSMNGAQTICKIREIDPEACCIMTTRSEEDQQSQAKARGLGVIAYYVKPLNIKRINFSITETKGFLKLLNEVKHWGTM